MVRRCDELIFAEACLRHVRACPELARGQLVLVEDHTSAMSMNFGRSNNSSRRKFYFPLLNRGSNAAAVPTARSHPAPSPRVRLGLGGAQTAVGGAGGGDGAGGGGGKGGGGGAGAGGGAAGGAAAVEFGKDGPPTPWRASHRGPHTDGQRQSEAPSRGRGGRRWQEHAHQRSA